MNKLYNEDTRFDLQIKQTQSYLKIILLGIITVLVVIYLSTKMTFNNNLIYMLLNIFFTTIFIFYIYYQVDFKIKPYKERIRLTNQIIDSKLIEIQIKVLRKNDPITMQNILFDEYTVLIDHIITRIFIEKDLITLEALKSYEILISLKNIVVGVKDE